jgi:ribose 5-phosphate isomerase RpiB
MIFTARQLEEMLRGGGQITLPYKARLTPLAQDLIRQRKIEVGYADVDAAGVSAQAPLVARPANDAPQDEPTSRGAKFLWWCDGPCGPAKAAVMAQSKETGLAELAVANEPGQSVTAIKRLAADLKAQRAAGGILLVQCGATAMLYANRCPSLRAVLGTCMQAVEHGAQNVAANVLVIEYPYKSLSQVKNLLNRFVRSVRRPDEELQRRLQDLSSCA